MGFRVSLHEAEEGLQGVVFVHHQVLSQIIDLGPASVLAVTFESKKLNLVEAEFKEVLGVLPTVVVETEPSARAHNGYSEFVPSCELSFAGFCWRFRKPFGLGLVGISSYPRHRTSARLTLLISECPRI